MRVFWAGEGDELTRDEFQHAQDCIWETICFLGNLRQTIERQSEGLEASGEAQSLEQCKRQLLSVLRDVQNHLRTA